MKTLLLVLLGVIPFPMLYLFLQAWLTERNPIRYGGDQLGAAMVSGTEFLLGCGLLLLWLVIGATYLWRYWQ